MKYSKTKKAITAFMLVAILFTTFQPKPAHGLFGLFDWMNGLIQGIGHSIQGTLLGIDSAANVTSAGMQAAKMVIDSLPIEYGAARRALSAPVAACEVSDGSFVVGLVDNLASSLAGVGDKTKATSTLFISRRLAFLEVKRGCYTVLSEGYKSAALVVVLTEQQKKAVSDTLDEIEQRMTPIKVQITDLQGQQKVSVQDIFLAIGTAIAQDINEQYTANAINEMKPKLALGSYGKTMDALASQIYTIENIKKNYDGDKSKQLIMTSLLDSELIPDGPGKRQAIEIAKATLDAQLKAKNCPKISDIHNFSDPDHFAKVATYNSYQCDPVAQFNSIREEFTGILTKGKVAAQTEVSNGGGFQSTRTCRNVTAQETQNRTRAAAAAKKYKAATDLVAQLEASGIKGGKAYIDAINAATKARDEMNALPQAIGGGVVVACGLISDPGGFVANQLNNYVNSWLQQSTNLKEGNIPLFAQLAKTLSRKLFKGIILNPDRSHEVLTELGSDFLNATLTGTSEYVASNTNPTGYTVPISSSQITGASGGSVQGVQTSVPVVPYTSPRGSAF